jgi:hypothetical protein
VELVTSNRRFEVALHLSGKRVNQACGLLPSCPQSRNSPKLFSNLARSVWLCRLPQFDRISLRVMHAGKPAGGIGRVNLDLDSCGP